MLTEKQKTLRTQGIGGSDSMIACGFPNFGKTPLTLYLEKTGEIEPPDLSDNLFIQAGHRMEPFIIKMYEEQTGTIVDQPEETFFSKTHPFMLANVDGIARVSKNKNQTHDILVEIKNISQYNASEWELDIPIKYKFQVAHYLAVLDLPRAEVVALIGGIDLKVFSYERDLGIEQKMIEAEEKFWDCVENKTPPLPTALEDLKYLKFKEGESITATQKIIGAMEKLKEVKEQSKIIEKKTSDLEFEIKSFIGENEILQYDGKIVATLKQHSREGLDVSAIKKNYPDICKQYSKSSSYRTLRLAK